MLLSLSIQPEKSDSPAMTPYVMKSISYLGTKALMKNAREVSRLPPNRTYLTPNLVRAIPIITAVNIQIRQLLLSVIIVQGVNRLKFTSYRIQEEIFSLQNHVLFIYFINTRV